MQNHPATSLLRKQGHPTASAAVYDGRDAVGSVVLVRDGKYVARDARGSVVGAFPTLREAVRSLPRRATS
jgi:hypothetical protein